MARQSDKKRPDLADYQRALARLIDTELKRGQRGDGKVPERHWVKWTDQKFADHAGISASSVANYRNPDKLSPPDIIVPLLKAFYGDIERFQPARAKMKIAWQLALGYEPDQPPRPTPWDIDNPKPFTAPVELVKFGLMQPVPGNEGTMIVTGTLRISPDETYEHNGQAVSIGLTEALIAVEAESWHPVEKSVFRGDPHENFREAQELGATWAVKPVDGNGRLDGKPFGEGSIVELEPSKKGDPAITLTVRAGRRAFKVLPCGTDRTEKPAGEVSDTQASVLQALFEDAYELDKKGRAILKRASMKPGGIG